MFFSSLLINLVLTLVNTLPHLEQYFSLNGLINACICINIFLSLCSRRNIGLICEALQITLHLAKTIIHGQLMFKLATPRTPAFYSVVLQNHKFMCQVVLLIPSPCLVATVWQLKKMPDQMAIAGMVRFHLHML